jgi:hypothetical protein
MEPTSLLIQLKRVKKKAVFFFYSKEDISEHRPLTNIATGMTTPELCQESQHSGALHQQICLFLHSKKRPFSALAEDKKNSMSCRLLVLRTPVRKRPHRPSKALLSTLI